MQAQHVSKIMLNKNLTFLFSHRFTFSGTRFLVFVANSGELVTYQDMPVKTFSPVDSWAEADPMEILSTVKKCLDVTIENLIQLVISIYICLFSISQRNPMYSFLCKGHRSGRYSDHRLGQSTRNCGDLEQKNRWTSAQCYSLAWCSNCSRRRVLQKENWPGKSGVDDRPTLVHLFQCIQDALVIQKRKQSQSSFWTRRSYDRHSGHLAFMEPYGRSCQGGLFNWRYQCFQNNVNGLGNIGMESSTSPFLWTAFESQAFGQDSIMLWNLWKTLL